MRQRRWRTLGRSTSGTASAIGEALGVDAAWDMYLAFGPGDDDLLRPRFWMHQLETDRAPRLDATEWEEQVRRLLTP